MRMEIRKRATFVRPFLAPRKVLRLIARESTAHGDLALAARDFSLGETFRRELRKKPSAHLSFASILINTCTFVQTGISIFLIICRQIGGTLMKYYKSFT